MRRLPNYLLLVSLFALSGFVLPGCGEIKFPGQQTAKPNDSADGDQQAQEPAEGKIAGNSAQREGTHARVSYHDEWRVQGREEQGVQPAVHYPARRTVAPPAIKLPPLSATPTEVVSYFLDALRAGDQDQTMCLLTAKAVQEMSRRDRAATPPGSPTAKYEVGQPEFDPAVPDAAYVPSQWYDQDERGQKIRYEITWVLRRETAGWRVAGMVTSAFEGEPPLILRFEDPDEMDRQQADVEARQRRMQDEAIQKR